MYEIGAKAKGTVTLLEHNKLKKGTKVKNIRLTSNPKQIEGNAPGIKGLVLLTKFVKKG